MHTFLRENDYSWFIFHRVNNNIFATVLKLETRIIIELSIIVMYSI